MQKISYILTIFIASSIVAILFYGAAVRDANLNTLVVFSTIQLFIMSVVLTLHLWSMEENEMYNQILNYPRQDKFAKEIKSYARKIYATGKDVDAELEELYNILIFEDEKIAASVIEEVNCLIQSWKKVVNK